MRIGRRAMLILLLVVLLMLADAVCQARKEAQGYFIWTLIGYQDEEALYTMRYTEDWDEANAILYAHWAEAGGHPICYLTVGVCPGTRKPPKVTQ